MAGRRPRRDGGGNVSPETLATGLGWFSIALGAAEVLAPGAFTRAIGTGGSRIARTASVLCGLRELTAGVGILTTPRPTGWLSSRVAGDLMDLALLLAAFGARRANRGRLLVSTASVVGVTALDAIAAGMLRSPDGSTSTVTARNVATIERPAEPLYRFWRDFSNMPRFMRRVQSVEVLGGRSHWRAQGPGGVPLEWDSEVTEDRPNERIAWRSLPGSRIDATGVVRFERAPGGRGTQVTVEMQYAPPGGAVTAELARLVGQAPEQQLGEDLRRFKQLMETGQVTVSEGSLYGVARPEGGAR
jgi:uncharacterized membrane protein